MRVLVTCFSQTGNTRQITEAIHQELVKSNQTDFMAVEQIDIERVHDYGLLFIGSPIHAGGLAAQIKDFLGNLPYKPGFKLAAFITHASSAYSRHGFESGIKQVEELCQKKEITYLGCFDCQGRLTPELHDAVQKAQNISDDEWAEKMAECDKHPNAEDEEDAKNFAREMLIRAVE